METINDNWYLVRINARDFKIKKEKIGKINVDFSSDFVDFVRRKIKEFDILNKTSFNEKIMKIKLLGYNGKFIKEYILISMNYDIKKSEELFKNLLKIPFIMKIFPFASKVTYNKEISDFLIGDNNLIGGYDNKYSSFSNDIPDVMKGKKVIIDDKNSSFFGYEGIIEHIGKNNAKIKIDFFGNSSIIIIPLDKIRIKEKDL